MSDQDGYLGSILGAAVGGLRMSGHSQDDIREWVEMALRTYETARSNQLLTNAAKGFTDAIREAIKDGS